MFEQIIHPTNSFRAHKSPICALIMVICLLSLVVGQSQAMAESRPVPSKATQADNVDWFIFLVLLHSLDNALKDPNEAPIPNNPTQSDDAAYAGDQTNRYNQSGVRPNLTKVEKDQALSDITSLRNTILDNPSDFTDPIWPVYLNTLDAMEADIQAQ